MRKQSVLRLSQRGGAADAGMASDGQSAGTRSCGWGSGLTPRFPDGRVCVALAQLRLRWPPGLAKARRVAGD